MLRVSALLAGLTARNSSFNSVAYEDQYRLSVLVNQLLNDAQKWRGVRDVVAADFGQEVADKTVFNTVD